MDTARWVKNAAKLSTTPSRGHALQLIEAGLGAIETKEVMKRGVQLDGDSLSVLGRPYRLSEYDRVIVLGFGKASCEAAQVLEEMLGERIHALGILMSESSRCEHPGHMPASHPVPTMGNVASTEKLLSVCGNLTDRDLILVIVSGGGSAMLCLPSSECEQGERLYHDAIRMGLTIHELNTVRKHISQLKGGGLASRLAPAQVVGLIFSDVPGTDFGMVASGPTWPDASTVADAQGILDLYGLTGYRLNETPKNPEIFKNVTNLVVVSNRVALESMADRASRLGYSPTIVDDSIYADPETVYAMLAEHASPGTAILAGGEFRIRVPNGGRGGRNSRAALTALPHLKNDMLFLSFASDGLDNSDEAGAVADSQTKARAQELGLDIRDYLARYDSHTFFEKTGSLITTGSTGANVADLMMLLIE